ncbi:MAG TPA: cytochrome c oxidase assembly protein [Actinomycetota bacterium]|nr:cytochrome c oxidase assembly protein [Actinomycetota bacterium]
MTVASAASAASPWTFHAHPDVWLVNGGLIVGYMLALAYLGPRRVPAGAPVATTGQKIAFFSGAALLWAGADWPMHDLSEHHLFSAHMVQHLLFMLVAPPLLLLGTPAWLLRTLLGTGLRFRVARLLTRPAAALIAFNGMIVFIHWPLVVELQSSSEPGHLAVHVLIVGASLLMWWPVLAPLPELATLSEPGKMFYLFLQSIVPTVPASFLTFASQPLYEPYADAGLWGLDAVTDQMIAGLLMKIGGGLLLWAVIAVLFFRWHSNEEKQEPASVSWEDFERELEVWDMRK